MLLVYLMSSLSAFATPAIMNYQAKLTDSNGLPITTTVTITSTFWDSSLGGNQLGDGFYDVDLVTPNSSGVVSTILGDGPINGIPASVFATDSVWLNVNVNGDDLQPRQRITSVGYAINALPLYGQNHIIPEVSTNPGINGQHLLAAVARAKTLTPSGFPRIPFNRVVVLVPPGFYDLSANNIVLDTDFVDLVGISSARDDQSIYGFTTTGTGVLRQTANDVHIENLSVYCYTGTGGLNFDSSDPAAYFPDSNLPGTVVRNCRFGADDVNAKSSRLAITYSGTYTDCLGLDDFLGGTDGNASGTFLNCQGGAYSFGGFGGTASGTFTNCKGGSLAFGSQNGAATGTFTNCSGGLESFGALGGVASGIFTNCSGGGGSFGGDGGTASGGRFHQCSGGVGSFTSLGTPTPLFTDCSLNGKPFLSSTPSQVVTGVTNDAAYNGGLLLLAYSYAAALRPNGQDLSTTNRATLIVPPGNYDMGTNQLTMYAEFVDVIGQTTARSNQRIFGPTAGQGTGVVAQPANDVHIENLLIECTRSSGGVGFNSLDPAAYFPDPISTSTVVRNCEFLSDNANAYTMRFGIEYKGTFVGCKGGSYAFGGYGLASGTFTDCTGGHASFGAAGTASGEFTNCYANSFSYGGSGTASGTFINCVGNGEYVFGGSGTSSGTFINCRGGDYAFGGGLLSVATGTFTGCVGGPSSFGGSGGSASGGRFYHCDGGANSFTTNGSPTVLYCVKNGVAYP